MSRGSREAGMTASGLLGVGFSTGGQAPVEPTTAGKEAVGSDSGPVGGDTSSTDEVSSTISLVEYPWIKAPGRVTTFSKEVRIQFSGSVDRQSVEERVQTAIRNTPYTLTWPSEREALLTLQSGCSFADLSMAGVKDAEGRELRAEQNPALALHYPCHGTGYTVIGVVDGQLLDGWPKFMGRVVDSDQQGRLLGTVGTIYFILEQGEIRSLTHTESSSWAQFLPGGDVLVADGAALRRVDSRLGRTVRQIDLTGPAINGAVSPDGRVALLLVGEQGGPVEAVMVDLESATATVLSTLTQSVERIRLHWRPEGHEVLVLSETGADWVLDRKTGEARLADQERRVESPDGRWVVDLGRKGIFATADPAGPARVAVTDEMIAGGRGPIVLRSLSDFQTCAPLQPLLLGQAAGELFVAYQDNCH